MTQVLPVTQKEMQRRTGLSNALGYAFPDKNLVLLDKSLKGKARKEVLAHEMEHISKGEEGPFWGAVVGGALSLLGSKKQASATKQAAEGMKTELPVYTGYGPGGMQAGLGVGSSPGQFSWADLISQAPGALMQQPGQQQGQQYAVPPGTGGIRGLPVSPALSGVQLAGQPYGVTAPLSDWSRAGTAGATPDLSDLFIENPAYTRWHRRQLMPESDPNSRAPTRYIVDPAKVESLRSGASVQQTAQAAQPTGFGVSLGELEPTRAGLTQLAQQAVGRAGALGGQLPAGVQRAAARFGQMGLPGMGNLAAFQGTAPGIGAGLEHPVGLGLGTPMGLGLNQPLGMGLGDPNAAMLQQQLRQLAGQTGATRAQMGQAGAGYTGALQRAAGMGGLGALQEAGMTGEEARARQLGLLREEAAPEEARQLQAFRERLQATGRGATTGGAQLTEAFARGLGQADVQRQLQAAGEGRSAQQQALARATGMTGLYEQQRGLQEELLSGAFGRFAQTQQLLGGLGQRQYERAFTGGKELYGRAREAGQELYERGTARGQELYERMGARGEELYGRTQAELARQQALEATQFQRGVGLNELAYGRAQEQLQTQMGLAQFAPQLQGQYLAPAIQALQAQSGLQTQALEPFQSALALAQAQANARIGAGSNVAAMMGGTNFGAPYQAAANLALGIGERWGQGGGGGSSAANLASAFGQAPALSSPSYMQQTPSNPFGMSLGV